MKKIIIGIIAFYCFSANGSPTNCKLEKMTTLEVNVVKFFQPFDSCKEARTNKGKLLGIIIKKNKSIISASYGDQFDFHPDSLIVKGTSKSISIKKLFTNLFSNNRPLNEYVKIQRTRINQAKIKAIIEHKKRIAFLELDAVDAPDQHSITYFFDQKNPNKYFSIGLTDTRPEQVISLLLNME